MSHNPLRSGALMLGAMLAYALNDACLKILLADLDIGQVMFLRGIFAISIGFCFVPSTRNWSELKACVLPSVLCRIGCELVSSITYMIALAHMSMASASAVLQTLPLMVTIGAALAFGEKVGIYRWSAIFAGLIGVLLILQPGAGTIDVFALLAFGSVIFAAIRDLLTRTIVVSVPSTIVSMLTIVAFTLVGGVMVILLGGWVPTRWPHLVLLFCSAFLVFLAYWLMMEAIRSSSISAVAPFRYSLLVWSTAFGILIFGDAPSVWAIGGGAIVVCAGLFTFYRERQVGGTRPAASSVGQSLPSDKV